MRTNLQIPMDKSLRDDAAQIAAEYGFYSLQDAVRMFITQLVSRKISIGITQQIPNEMLTRKQEEILTKRYNDTVKEMKAGKAFTATGADDLISQLGA